VILYCWKVVIGLASHWPCVRDIQLRKEDEHHIYISSRNMVHLLHIALNVVTLVSGSWAFIVYIVDAIASDKIPVILTFSW